MKKLFKKLNAVPKESTEEMTAKPYEERNKIYPLSLVVTIINRGQSNYFVEEYAQIGASISMVLYGYSMPPEEYRNILGVDSTKKEIILTYTRAEYVSKLLEVAKTRFAISPAAKGIAFSCPIDSVSGISAYKFLADQNQERRFVREWKKQQKHMK